MPNAKDADIEAFERILCVGRTGSGKSAQMWTLPGRKFAYIFDPNTLATIRGLDIDYELFQPDVLSVDMTLKGFNKGSVSDKPKGDKKKEPLVWNAWGDHFNSHYDKGFFTNYDWLIFDSFTFITKAVMDRNLYINGRYGDIEDLSDFRVVGAKISEVFGTIATMNINIYATGHLAVFQDEKTKKIETLLHLPGKAKNMLPLQFTNIWLTQVTEGGKYEIRTKPEARGLQDIRSSIQGLQTLEDVTIKSFGPESVNYGIGAIYSKSRKKGPANAIHQASTR